MTNERKAELLKMLRLEVQQTWIALHHCGIDNEELQFVHFEKNRILAELDYSIKYYEEHNSLDINVYCNNKDIPHYHGTFGDFKNSVYKQKYGNIEISHAYPMFKEDDTFNVMLDADCAKSYLEDLEKIDQLKEVLK